MSELLSVTAGDKHERIRDKQKMISKARNIKEIEKGEYSPIGRGEREHRAWKGYGVGKGGGNVMMFARKSVSRNYKTAEAAHVERKMIERPMFRGDEQNLIHGNVGKKKYGDEQSERTSGFFARTRVEQC